ncbi:aldo/keto reductase [Segnochrobactrum spirostomi]|uniref:Aldo/keto reductase n=1 Tax=Segnochrobactrum spirostomi TaxID=2608987 RepID=A0A6A7Y144_9HYPH|nr:aldo/keto reductase [Segnochrobactrum spirostomi]MQT11649.1 aldo/keto reductase [Segnochrobactrum spirostomi]
MDITETRKLGRTDVAVTVASFGGAPIGNLFAPVSREAAEGALAFAWDAGLRYFDTAPYYGFGLSERRIGDFLRDKPRGSYVVSSKVGRLLLPLRGKPVPDRGFAEPLPFEPVYDYSYDGVMRSHEASLHRLGLDRIDVLLLHDIGTVTHGAEHPRHFRDAMEGGVRALQELKAAGDIGAYGIGVNEVEVLLEALGHADFDCFLLAGRFTLLDQIAAQGLLQTCHDRGTTLIIGGVFNSGILVTGPVPGARYNYEPAPADILARVARIKAVCDRFGVPLPAAALQFPLSHPAVSTVLTGVTDRDMLSRNLEGFRVPVPPALWDALVEDGLLRAELRPAA